jgi:hypothetical protein
MAFLFLAFSMKVAGEAIHELIGHGIFVLLFGGEVVTVHISLLWPYELSFIEWSGSFAGWQQAWVDGGGILVSLVVSFACQTLLLLKIVKNRFLSASLLWLSFWTFLSPAGYLIIGAIRPFGDVVALISEGVLTQGTSLLIGIGIFLLSFFSTTPILANLLSSVDLVRDVKGLRIALSLFWLIVPTVTAINCLGRGQPLVYLLTFTTMSFLPVLAVHIILPLLLKNLKTGRYDS